MISKRELEDVVVQVNAAITRLDKRIDLLEKQQNQLLHEIKEFVQKPAKGRPKNSG